MYRSGSRVSGLLVGREQLLELTLVVLIKSFQVVDLILVRFLLALGIVFVLLHDVHDFFFEAHDFALKLLAGLSELSDVCLHLVFLLLGHEGLAHAVGY